MASATMWHGLPLLCNHRQLIIPHKPVSLPLASNLSQVFINHHPYPRHHHRLVLCTASKSAIGGGDLALELASDVLVGALEREAGAKHVFSASRGDIREALSRSGGFQVTDVGLEQGALWAALGYARASGLTGVCVVNNGTTDVTWGVADAYRHSIPLVVIVWHHPLHAPYLASDGRIHHYPETPLDSFASQQHTKTIYQVQNVEDVPYIIREAFITASTGRPGPVLIDIRQQVQKQQLLPAILGLQPVVEEEGFKSATAPPHPDSSQICSILDLISESKRPLLYVGGGCVDCHEDLKRFVEYTGIPVATTLTSLGSFPSAHQLSLGAVDSIQTHYEKKYVAGALNTCDLLLAFGVWPSKLKLVAPAAAPPPKIVLIDIDLTKIVRNKEQASVSLCTDVKLALEGLNSLIQAKRLMFDFSPWIDQLFHDHTLSCSNTLGEDISRQSAMKLLDELTDGKAIIASSCGIKQLQTAQLYNFRGPRQWLTAKGLPRFALPAAIGAIVAKPDSIVVDIEHDDTYLSNVCAFDTIIEHNLPVKVLMLTNNRQVSGKFTYMTRIAKSYGIPSARVTKQSELRDAIQKMLDTPRPYMLDVVIIPRQDPGSP